MDVSKNKFLYGMGVTIISNVLQIPLFIGRHVTRFQPINVSKSDDLFNLNIYHVYQIIPTNLLFQFLFVHVHLQYIIPLKIIGINKTNKYNNIK